MMDEVDDGVVGEDGGLEEGQGQGQEHDEEGGSPEKKEPSLPPLPTQSAKQREPSLDSKALKAALVAALKGVSTTGAFATSGVVQEDMPPFTPRIEVLKGGVGVLGLPLCESQGSQPYASGTPAPHGQGHATVLDPAVRSARQYDASEVAIGAAWGGVLRRILGRVCAGLGIEGESAASLRAELYKVLVYEKGDHFLTHRDSEKGRGMFGSLIIALPSQHEGGCLTIRHGPGVFKADFGGPRSSEDLRYVAFFADCPHSLAEVTSGRRLVLAYNLFTGSGSASGSGSGAGGGGGFPTLKAPPLQEGASPATLLKAAVSRWGFGSPRFLALPLEHRYTETSLGFKTLKRHDKALVQQLLRTPSLEVHLGLAQLEVEGGAEEPGYSWSRKRGRGEVGGGGGTCMTEEYDRSTSIRDGSWKLGPRATPELQEMLGDVLDEKRGMLISSEPLFDEEGEPDDEKYEGYTGNAGPTIKHTYFKAVAVFFPRAHVPHLLKGGTLAPLGQAAERVAGYIPQGWASLRSKSYLGVMRTMMASNAMFGVPTPVLGLLSRAVQAAPTVPHVKAAANAAVRAWLKGQAGGASTSSSSSSSSSMYSYRHSMYPRATSPAVVKTEGFIELQALLAVLPPLETEALSKPLGECLATPSGVSVRYPEQARSLVSQHGTSPPVLAHLHLRLLDGLLSGVPLTKDPWASSSGYTRTQSPINTTVGDACTAASAALLWPAPEASWRLPEDLHPTYMEKLRAALREAGPTIAGARLRATLALPRVAAALAAGDVHATSLRTLLSDLRAARMAELAPEDPVDALKALEEEVYLAKNDWGGNISGSGGSGSGGSGSGGSGSTTTNGSEGGETQAFHVGGEEGSLRALLVRALLSASLPPSPKSPPWLHNDTVVAAP